MRWQFPKTINIPKDFQQTVGGHPVVSEMLIRRGITTPEQARRFLNPDLVTPASPLDLPNMQAGIATVNQAIKSGELITIWGDFDVDGQTATSLLLSALRQMGAQVNYTIPIRGRETHGISLPRLKEFIAAGTKLLLTCDTGVSEHESIAYARSHGVAVVVTDHHKLPLDLPNANSIIDPNFLPESHPLSALPGVGVAYKFMEALASLRQPDFDPFQFLDLVALGIVADVASLHGDNRYLLQKGLLALQKTQRLGLLKLIEKAELNRENIDEELIGYQIAPRLNAVGRLSDANPIVELMLTLDEGRAEVIATQIEGLNLRRKLLTREVTQAALRQIEADPELHHAPAIVLYHPEWPGGIIGLVASHLVGCFNKPAILLTGTGNTIHGSARSIPSLDITEAIRAQSKLLNSFGGHAMAGGLSMPSDNLPAFRSGIYHYVSDKLNQVDTEPVLEIAANLDLTDLSIDLIEDFRRLAPFGPGNPSPNFISTDLQIESHKIVGRNQEHRQVVVSNSQDVVQKVIWWNGAEDSLPEGKFDLVYHLTANDFRGQHEVNLVWIDAKQQVPVEGPKPGIQIHDHRLVTDPDQSLREILAINPQALVWAESQIPADIQSHTRVNLDCNHTLIVWNVPPSQKTLTEIIAQVKPMVIHFFANPSNNISSQTFMNKLAGLLKYAINQRDGRFSLTQLAIASAQSSEVVRLGLRWLQEKGLFTFSSLLEEDIQVKPGYDLEGSQLDQITHSLTEFWKEYQAWQQFYRTCEANKLVL